MQMTEAGFRALVTTREDIAKLNPNVFCNTIRPAVRDYAMLVPEKHSLRPNVCFRSKTEKASLAYLTLLMADQDITLLYEPILFRLPGGNYTPDWMVIAPNGVVCFIEVKGSNRGKGMGSGRSSKIQLRTARAHYPNFKWLLLVKEEGDTWSLEEL